MASAPNLTSTVDEEKVDATLVDPNLRIVSEKLGTWDLHITVESSFNIQKKLAGIRASIPLLRRLLFDIYRLSPILFIFFFLSNIWTGVETAFLMHMSNRLLTIIEIGIRSGNSDLYSILFAVGARLISQVIVGVVEWWADHVVAVLQSRVKYYFEFNLMRTKLRADLPTSQDASSKIELTSHGLWSAFEEIMSFLSEIMATASQLALIYHVSRATGGPLFTILCIVKPFVSTMFQRSLWDKVSLVILTNPFHLRMKALENLMEDKHRPDIINGNLEGYVLNEYEKARTKLGDTPNEDPYQQYSRRPMPFFQIGDNILGDLPIIYCALSAIVNPDNFSLASIAILQNSSSHLRYSIQSILMRAERFRQNINSIKTFYQCLDVDVKNQVPNGHMPYPQPNKSSEKGMALELRNVCFSYPGSTKTTNALKNVSLSIKSGQLVVIVGANGGGKSTIIKLLSRLYSPTSGEMFVDGIPANDYQTSSLRQAIAILGQSSSVFPFSLGENIGVGCPDHVADTDMIRRAAEKGGASDFISKFSTGMDTLLDPTLDLYYSFNLYNNIENPLHARMKEIPKKVEVSGGEEQRLIAARTFMRFNSGKIRFVAVDEPSSALDAEGELQLFENLIEARAGKTMVFVTHRFGHLTKHADQIICMKDGAVAESGTHDELMSLCGEYAKLYDIQARAFSNPAVV